MKYGNFSLDEGFTSNIYDVDATQLARLNSLTGGYSTISGELAEYQSMYYTLTQGDLSNNPYNNFSHTGRPDVKEAVLEDIREVVQQQNNQYTVGMICVATLVVACFVMFRK